MPNMNVRAALAVAAQRTSGRARSVSLSTVAPAEDDEEYLPELATIAASILYRSPSSSLEGRSVYILNAAAFPDAHEVDYDALLAYVLARLPGEEELIAGAEYEVIFLAGGTPDNATAEKKEGPSTGWYLQAYHVLSRATRKKLRKLYIVHPRTWVRILVNLFGSIVSPKFRRKIIHVNSLSQLALHVPLEKLLIPPSAYLQDRKVTPEVYVPFVTGKRAFGMRHPLPKDIETGRTRLPRVLRETTSFLLLDSNVKTEGLFRIPPHNGLLGVLKEAYDRGQQFIVWKDVNALYASPGLDASLLDEVRLGDAYGLHLAASLIKTWYRELRQPIFAEECYPMLREKYQDPSVRITAEDLANLLLPTSKSSPLTDTSREIITRHLLPLLSAVAAHEASNKMSPENLAICFSMCLICGTNQVEDGRVSTMVKRVLEAAIRMWPELRTGMGVDEKAFVEDLQPPTDIRDYEDVMEDQKYEQPSQHEQNVEGHRILMDGSDGEYPVSPEAAPPALPPRRSRAASLKKAIMPRVLGIELPALPKPKADLPTVPRRKAAPHHETPTSDTDDIQAVERISTTQPPRYSTLFDSDGQSVHTGSPNSYVPADGFGPPRRANFSFDEDEEKGSQSIPPRLDSLPVEGVPTVPKRKAIPSQKSSPEEANISPTFDAFRGPSEPSTASAKMVAQQATNNPSYRVAVKNPPATTEAKAKLSNGAPPAMDQPAGTERVDVFRKPSWPASANRQPNIQSLAKPFVPTRHTQTVPTITGLDSSSLHAPNVPRPRAPSPGLLKRMSSMESASNRDADSTAGPSGGLEPRRMEPKRLKSVEDLKRLYEERVSTAQTLASVSVRRVSSNQ